MLTPFFTKASKIVSLNKYYGLYYNIRDDEEDSSTCNSFNRTNYIKMYKGFKRILNYLEENNRSYPQFEYQLLIGFSKWTLLSECENENKIKIYKQFKRKYNGYSLFFRLENLSLLKNILINCFMKVVCFNEFSFRTVLKILDIKWFKQKLQNSHFAD